MPKLLLTAILLFKELTFQSKSPESFCPIYCQRKTNPRNKLHQINRNDYKFNFYNDYIFFIFSFFQGQSTMSYVKKNYILKQAGSFYLINFELEKLPFRAENRGQKVG